LERKKQQLNKSQNGADDLRSELAASRGEVHRKTGRSTEQATGLLHPQEPPDLWKDDTSSHSRKAEKQRRLLRRSVIQGVVTVSGHAQDWCQEGRR